MSTCAQSQLLSHKLSSSAFPATLGFCVVPVALLVRTARTCSGATTHEYGGFPGFVCHMINCVLQSRDGRHGVVGLAGLPVGYASFDTA